MSAAAIRSKLLAYSDFVGVVNEREPSSLDLKELVDCNNLYVTPYGSLKARPGLEKIAELAGADFKAIGYYSVRDRLYLASGTTLYELDPSTGNFSNIGTLNSAECTFVEAFGKLWIADGGKLKYVDSAGNFGNVDDFVWFTETIATGNGSTTSFNATLSELPVTPNSVTVSYTVGGTQYQATDDGEGNINGTHLIGTINYTTGEISLTFTTAPDNGTPIDVTYSASQVLDVRAEDIEFKDERLYVSYGTDIYISEVRDPSRWEFISINKQDGADITAIHRYYDKLVIFKGYPYPAIYVLSGYRVSTFTVSRVSRFVSCNDKYSVIAFKGDLFFIWGKRVYSLTRVMSYGDVEPQSLTQHFNPADTTSQSRFAIALPEEGVIWFLGRTDARSFSFTPQRSACAFLSFGAPVRCGVNVKDDVYLAGGDGVYRLSPFGTDDGNDVIYQVRFAWTGSAMTFMLAKRFALNVKAIESGTLHLYHEGKQVAIFNMTSPALWDYAIWDSANWGASYLEPLQKRQVIHERFLKLMLTATKRFELLAVYVDAEVKHG